MKFSFALSLLLLLAIVFGTKGFALTSAERDYSNLLEARLAKLIQLYDSTAAISVSVRTKPNASDAKWTGINAGDQVSELVSHVSDADVTLISIKIFSNKLKITPEIIKQFSDFLGLSPRLLAISVTKLAGSIRSPANETLEWQKNFLQLFQSTSSQAQPLFQLLAFSILGLGVCLLLGIVVAAFLIKRSHNPVHTGARSLDHGGSLPLRPEVSNLNSDETPIEAAANHDLSGSSEHFNLRTLTSDSWISLLSDCYWCEQDNYAAWLWLNMPHDKRKEVLQQWPLAIRYVEFITTLTPNERFDHHQPSYIEPLPTSLISQNDLQQLVRTSSSLWRFLSPMRKGALRLPISEIVALESLPLKFGRVFDASAFAQSPASPPRVLPVSLNKTDLTSEDEQYLFSHFDEIPFSTRECLMSWVWVALLPDDEAKQLLVNYSAADLAGAWIGADEILSNIELLVPQQKLDMIKDYRKSITPSWRSPVLIELTRLACRRLQSQAQSLTGAA